MNWLVSTWSPPCRSVRDPIARREQISPELVLIDPALRERLLAQMARRAAVEVDNAGASVAPARETVVAAQPRSETRRLRLETAKVRLAVAVVTIVGLSAASVLGIRALLPGPTATETVGSAQRSSAARSSPRLAVAGKSRAQTGTFVSPKAANSGVGQAAGRHVVLRDFAWAPAAGAGAYEVAFYRAGVEVFRSYTIKPTIAISVIPRGTATTTPTSVAPGTYEWYVWALRNSTRGNAAIVESRVVLTAG